LIDISEEDGWIVTLKGIEYIKNHKSVTWIEQFQLC
jgi:hypothetical protein